MSLELTLAQWKASLTGLGKVINKRASLPVLSAIHVHQENGQAALQATDLDRMLSHFPEVPGPDQSFLLPFESLQRVVKGADRNTSIRVSPDGAEAVTIESTVAGQTIRQRHDVAPLKDWPSLPAVTVPVNAVEDSFKSALRQALDCSGRDESRHVLRGACLDATDKGDYIVGTDGRHLYAANSFTFPQRQPVIIPAHKFLTWKGFAEDGEWSLAIQTGKETNDIRNIQLQSVHWRYVTRPIEGTFPNWRNVVPKRDDNTVVTLAPESVAWLQSTLPKLPVDNASTKSLLFCIGKQQLSIQSGATSGGVDLVVPDAEVRGNDVTVALNRDFVLKALKFGFTTMHIGEPLEPILFTAPGRQMIIMPVRQAKPAPTAASPRSRSQTPLPSGNRINKPEPTNERKSMSANSAPPTNGEAQPNAVANAIGKVETLRNHLREINSGLGEALRALKDAAKEQRNTEREVNTIRNRLRSLQSVEI